MEMETLTPPARLALFGFRPAAAEVKVTRRTRSWRVSRAVGSLVGSWVVIPVVAIVPPHIPWAILAFVAGVYLFFKFWTEEYTVLEFRASCPKCSADQELGVPTRLRRPHPLTCQGCQQDLLLEVDAA